MDDKTILTAIGYWHSFSENSLPDPGTFVNDQWAAEEREQVVAYLKAGHPMPYAYGGRSWCRFRCGYMDMGSLEYTDGTYLWPEGLYHYIESHDVTLPQAVTEHMLNNKEVKPVTDNYTVNRDWWNNQQGSNTTIKTFNDLLDIGILTITQANNLQKAKQEYVLRQYFLDVYGVKSKYKSIDQILSGQETSIKGRYKNISQLLSQLPAIGLQGTFRYLTKEEYGVD